MRTGSVVYDPASKTVTHVDSAPAAKPEAVEHPRHYNASKSGVECIDVVRYMSFSLGNAVKYLWRFDEKDKPVEDLKKALWYVNDYRRLGHASRHVPPVPIVKFLIGEPSEFKRTTIQSLWLADMVEENDTVHLGIAIARIQAEIARLSE